jgi:hypothetical protein
MGGVHGYHFHLPKARLTLTELIAKLEDARAQYGELPVLYAVCGEDPGRYVSVEDGDVLQCTADNKGMKRANAGDPAVACLVLYT